jgi:hypothetical protein
MTQLADLERELVAAATRRAPSAEGARGRRALLGRPWSTPVVVAFLALAVAATGTAVAALTGVVGGPPTTTFPRVHGEERSGMVRTTDPYVMGVANVAGVARIELVGYRMRGYKGHGILNCLDLALPNGIKGGACDAGLSGEAGGIMGTGAEAGRPINLATGVGDTDVARVVVHFRVGPDRASRQRRSSTSPVGSADASESKRSRITSRRCHRKRMTSLRSGIGEIAKLCGGRASSDGQPPVSACTLRHQSRATIRACSWFSLSLCS